MEGIAAAFGVNWKLLLIQIVNFGILLFVLQKFLYKPLLAMIDKRKIQIEKGIENALDAETKLNDAKTEADVLISEAKKKGLLSIESAKDSARVAGEGIVKRAEEEKNQTIVASARRKRTHKRKSFSRRFGRNNKTFHSGGGKSPSEKNIENETSRVRQSNNESNRKRARKGPRYFYQGKTLFKKKGENSLIRAIGENVRRELDNKERKNTVTVKIANKKMAGWP